ncbi:aspartyl-phosphate phosphatase Spo0E family protein [Paenibacillus sp. IB182496]|uniref:Aspartyl-phosphate phosphatase Spo0E family protein n=1 Tax=Paenibacillus sabuli TaxID=2772509 RepID=A0A927GTK4_9BACL|nr:aspartyl-phosphate phosphatase Spo0E family protein [Paenibacillus sabuli]MBD2846827.1 aspartyl-phosphate phosphatase Spo0E family protein [Paenibacillus sabuli]
MDTQWMAHLEGLRRKMIETATNKQSLLHRDVLRLSQALDRLIVKAQREQTAQMTPGKWNDQAQRELQPR